MYRKARHNTKSVSILLCVVSLFLVAAAVFGIWRIVSGAFAKEPAQPARDNWALTLVNETYSVPDNWEVTLTTLSNGERVDSRMYPDLQQMFDDMRTQGMHPFVRAGYRSESDQKALLRNRVLSYMEEGASLRQAKKMAEKYVAEPGTSEHELGLAVDINADAGSTADEVYAWLAQNAWRYGFVLRYPSDKADITGIDYEPWHYRYVGKDAAKEMQQSGECLEEYLGVAD